MPKKRAHMYAAKHIKEIDRIVHSFKNVGFISVKEYAKREDVKEEEAKKTFEMYRDNIREFKEKYEKYRNMYEKGKLLKGEEMLTKEEAEECKKAHREMANLLEGVYGAILFIGDDKSDEYATGAKYITDIINLEADKAEEYKGGYPVKVEDFTCIEPLDFSLAHTDTLSQELEEMEGLSQRLSANRKGHKNSKEYTEMVEAVNRYVKAAAGITEKGGVVSPEDRYELGNLMESIAVKAGEYIKAKGGPVKQHTQMGKERMAAAVRILGFVNEKAAKYPGAERMQRHYYGVFNANYPQEEKQLAAAKVNYLNNKDAAKVLYSQYADRALREMKSINEQKEFIETAVNNGFEEPKIEPEKVENEGMEYMSTAHIMNIHKDRKNNQEMEAVKEEANLEDSFEEPLDMNTLNDEEELGNNKF